MNPRTTPSPATLDKWDIAFIRHFKSRDGLDMEALHALWAERCGIDIEFVRANGTSNIAEYLANLIDRLNLTPDLFKTIMYLDPVREWYVGIPSGVSHYTRTIYVMASWLRLTEVKYLPGYREAVVLLEQAESKVATP